MKTFDYAAAWRELARPAFNNLPAEVLALLARVAVEARELRQLPDLTQQWPNDGGDLRRAFHAIDPDALALASRVIYCTGHWWPANGRGVELPGREHGSHWKFSHYADQVLRRDTLSTPTDANSDTRAGLGWAIHEGVLRLQYASPDTWTWVEVAPGTPAGLKAAGELRRRAEEAIAAHPARARYERDSDVSKVFEALRGSRAIFAAMPWPWAALMATDAYMVEEGDEKPDPDKPPRDLDAERRHQVEQVQADLARKVRILTHEATVKVWWLERGIPVDNLIYYHHTDRWCFGWRHPIGPELLSRILHEISECGHPYQIKTHDGRTLEGNIE